MVKNSRKYLLLSNMMESIWNIGFWNSSVRIFTKFQLKMKGDETNFFLEIMQMLYDIL